MIHAPQILMPPPEAPLAMPPQALHRAPAAPRLAADGRGVQAARLFVFGFAGATTTALGAVMHDWFNAGGLGWVELAILICGVAAAFWIALSVATAVLGCLPRRSRPAAPPARPLDVAVLLPLHGEDAHAVAANLRALMAGLSAAGPRHRFALYVLSDTRDPAAALAEQRVMVHLGATLPGSRVHYRRRPENLRFKAGNLQDWVQRWGGAHDAMLVLDADSVMTPDTVLRLADALAAEPRLGLVQTVPRLIGGQTPWARAQQFSNTIYGATLGRGLALWAGSAANYWGHNAMIRTRAFAAAAGLPDLPGRRPFGGLILSHDFVEAALLRRAGWRVRFLPEAEGSFEETPPTPIAHILRDRRWCQGNLQHLRLLGAAGLHPLSRMHMLQGAVGYLSSILWLVLMICWVLVGNGQGDGPIRYFSDTNPLFPAWPDMDLVSRILILGLIYGMLVAPKILGALRYWAGDPALRGVGGPLCFLGSILAEMLLSILLAPMLMIQHVIAVMRSLAGIDAGWTPPRRDAPDLRACLRFHAAELVLGVGMCMLFALGELTLWLLPVGVSLAAAPVLSRALSARPGWARHLFRTPQETGLGPEATAASLATA
ncbi:glucans biosynthesis glucosyltransferase MdoH [Rhodobacteraceae bacterium 2CG4]|uniref:Glucans biosynthesis glucosyltransferase H n=1 Tax=Halovulum marinum TaxID=2662447 RepID=A0A6L5Z0F1_9RHOB|nr:glucans biosynthesis glucosyltransferase MdoH [Halovulum marinum]MSU89454.1 glucans biosynthesis glucosyltransferase MdoH [Halovulum marinum]